MDPLYTPANVTAAYQLRWWLSVFANAELPPPDCWLSTLQQAVERDRVRILEVGAKPKNVWQFYLTTRPEVAPPAIVKSVKGRLQHLLQPTHPNAFRRNFLLTAVGDARREVVEDYVSTQLEHHRMADERVQKALKSYQHEFPEVGLGERQLSAHGAYFYSLHLVLIHDGRWSEVREDELVATHDMALRVAVKKQHAVSRLSLLADHLHLTAHIPPQQSPQDVALGYLNNLAYAHGMRAIYSPSYYVGTIGEYDTGEIWTALASNRAPTDAGSVESWRH
ncbi:MAG: hypothetical protein EXS05_17650 [Planctomycetaceae bacterium]|nr:hypothetical protein [Planctomycetaceae bacterium]